MAKSIDAQQHLLLSEAVRILCTAPSLPERSAYKEAQIELNKPNPNYRKIAEILSSQGAHKWADFARRMAGEWLGLCRE